MNITDAITVQTQLGTHIKDYQQQSTDIRAQLVELEKQYETQRTLGLIRLHQLDGAIQSLENFGKTVEPIKQTFIEAIPTLNTTLDSEEQLQPDSEQDERTWTH